MQLTDTQLAQYESEGFLFFEGLLSAAELAVLEEAVPEIVGDPARPGVKREDGSDAVRMVHGTHLHNETARRLARHPRLLDPARAIVGSGVYVFQSRLVLKPPLEGRAFPGFPWHQDYSTWHLLDGIPEPRAVVIAVFLDEVTACNAPILIVPRSHRGGMIGTGERDPEKYEQIVIDRETLARLATEGGMQAVTGPPGSVLFMHCNLVHASGENLSPFRRAIYYVIYNSTLNVGVGGTRQQHHSATDTTSLEPFADDCLVPSPSAPPVPPVGAGFSPPSRTGRAKARPYRGDYERDGVIAPIRVLTNEETRHFREEVERLCQSIGHRKRLDQCHLYFRWAYDLATHPAILDAAQDLLGDDVIVHSSRIFWKPPHDPAYVSWHQDGRYTGLNSCPVTTAWIALSDSTIANGCLRVVPGSHTAGVFPHTETEGLEDNLVNHGQEVATPIAESSVRDIPLRAGEMSFHHINMVHGSKPNGSDTHRIGFSLSYATPAVGRASYPVIRARGTHPCPQFELMQTPPRDSLADYQRFLEERK